MTLQLYYSIFNINNQPQCFYSKFNKFDYIVGNTVLELAPLPTTWLIKLFHVFVPIIPSAVRPFLFWKDITELFVLTPNTPSNPPVSYPSVLSASCAIHTYTPLLPCLTIGYPEATWRSSKCTHLGVKFPGFYVIPYARTNC